MNELLRSIFGPLTALLGAGLQTFCDWGAPPWLAIVLLTVVVRALLFPLTAKQAGSMRRLQELKPEMDEIRARHKGDSKRQQEAMMELYTERRVNPLGGCLPLLVQLPIFLALYYTISGFGVPGFESGGLLWFRDLTAPDPYYALPAIYAITFIFGLFLAIGDFPAGLFVYWISSNLITLVQNYLIYHHTPRPLGDA